VSPLQIEFCAAEVSWLTIPCLEEEEAPEPGSDPPGTPGGGNDGGSAKGGLTVPPVLMVAAKEGKKKNRQGCQKDGREHDVFIKCKMF
jgi:hypothetical protein